MPIIKLCVPLILLVTIVLAGCGSKYIQSSLPAELDKHSVKEVGLIPFVVKAQTSGELRSGTVAEGATKIITDQFYNNLIERHVTVVRWEEQEAPPSGGETAPITDMQRAQQIGELLKTSTVLFGSVTTFVEREGSALGIRKPASVGFTVQLIHAEDGHILWKASYYETQKSLMEDIAAFRLFFKRHGRWLTAAELSEDGIERLLEVSPWANMKAD
jgi:hypothetical protein